MLSVLCVMFLIITTKAQENPETYSVKNLLETKKHQSELPKKYKHLLSDAMFAKVAPKKSVKRATRDDSEDDFGVLLPMSVRILESQITLKLFDVRKDSAQIQWNIQALTVGEELLFENTVQANKVDLDLSKYLTENSNIILHIKALDKNGKQLNKHSQGKENMISTLESDEAERLKFDLEQLLNTIADPELKLLVKARFYEEYELVADAITAYETLIELEPQAKIYRQAYDAFLFRFGLTL